MRAVIMNVGKLPFINEILRPPFKASVFAKEVDRFGFTGIQEYLVLILLKHKLILEI
jgi:hypothetical protein